MPASSVFRALSHGRQAREAKVYSAVVWPLRHGRACLVGLLTLQAFRVAGWKMGSLPGGGMLVLHCLSIYSDVMVGLSSLPLVISNGFTGKYVKLGCLGPMMTMLVAMNVIDLGCAGMCMGFVFSTPLLEHEGSMMDVGELLVNVWVLSLLTSMFLQVSLTTCVWRIYRELRVAGLYPPHAAREVPRESISPFEVLCEGEDLALLGECQNRLCGGCCAGPDAQRRKLEDETDLKVSGQRDRELEEQRRQAEAIAEQRRADAEAERLREQKNLEDARRAADEAAAEQTRKDEAARLARVAQQQKQEREQEAQANRAMVEEFLKEHGYDDVNSKRKKHFKSKYPLHTAVKHKPEMVRRLLRCDADPTLKNSGGKTPRQLAEAMGASGLGSAKLADVLSALPDP